MVHKCLFGLPHWPFVVLFPLRQRRSQTLYGLKGLHELFLEILFFGPFKEQRNDGSKGNSPLIIGVEHGPHLFDFVFGGAMAEAAHEGGELSGWNAAGILLVEDWEDFLVVDQFFFWKAL